MLEVRYFDRQAKLYRVAVSAPRHRKQLVSAFENGTNELNEVGSQARSEHWILWVLLTCYHTLPETNMSPENGWLEDDRFLLGFGPFSGANC